MSVTELDHAELNHQAISAKKVASPDVLPTPQMPTLRSSPKIRDRHRDRLAVVYVRQSSPHQVLENRESRERQYGLATLAQQFGWPADRVLVIDEDQGLSGKQAENRSFPGVPGVPRSGEALLSGLVVCGRCGHRMTVAYHPGKKKKPHYGCDTHLHEERDQPCLSIKAPPVDELVAQQVLLALRPAAIDLSLQAATDIRRERERLHRHWQQRLERSHYESQRAERQYESVEPENRLVARTLEQRWEESLRVERQLREEYDRFLATTPATLNDDDAKRIREASQNIVSLWNAESTTFQDRKEIVRCLVDRVIVHVEAQSEYADVTIHWHGGFTSQHQVVRPVGCYRQLRDYDQLISRIKMLHGEGKNVPAIAEQLNREGFVPPRRRGPYTVGALLPLLQREGLVGERRRDDLLGADEWRVRDLAARLQILPCRIYYWISQNWLHARRTLSGQTWIAWADRDELKRLEKLKMTRNSHTARRNPDLVVPKVRK